MKSTCKQGRITSLFSLFIALCFYSTVLAAPTGPEEDIRQIMAGSDPILDTIATYDGWNLYYSRDGITMWVFDLDGAAIEIISVYDSEGDLSVIGVEFNYLNGTVHVYFDYSPGYGWNTTRLEGEEDQQDG